MHIIMHKHTHTHSHTLSLSQLIREVSEENGGVIISFPHSDRSDKVVLKGAKQCIEGAKTRILEIVADLVSLGGWRDGEGWREGGREGGREEGRKREGGREEKGGGMERDGEGGRKGGGMERDGGREEGGREEGWREGRGMEGKERGERREGRIEGYVQ